MGPMWVQVEQVKLEDASTRRAMPSRGQEVLHYQWFADLGNPEAQRRVGQLLSMGAEQNPQQALHYFQYVPAVLLLPPSSAPSSIRSGRSGYT
jgi:hypothetical protein